MPHIRAAVRLEAAAVGGRPAIRILGADGAVRSDADGAPLTLKRWSARCGTLPFSPAPSRRPATAAAAWIRAASFPAAALSAAITPGRSTPGLRIDRKS